MEQHDPQLSQAYQEAEHPVPPAVLDVRILTEARKAVAPQRHRSVWFAWAVPLSTTAVLVLGISLLFQMQQDTPDVMREAMPLPPAELHSPPAAAVTKPPPIPAVGPEARPRPRQSAQPSPPPAAPPAAADSVAAMPDRGSVSEAATPPPPQPTAQIEQSKAFPAETAKILPAAPAANPARLEHTPTAAASVRQSPSQHKMHSRFDASLDSTPEGDIEAWVESIRLLLQQGRAEDARRSLADLRERYPNYPLPDDLKPYAR